MSLLSVIVLNNCLGSYSQEIGVVEWCCNTSTNLEALAADEPPLGEEVTELFSPYNKRYELDKIEQVELQNEYHGELANKLIELSRTVGKLGRYFIYFRQLRVTFHEGLVEITFE